MDRIDFRSDTVSWPTPAMRLAMAEARVGDDVYGEDPTTNEMEALAAEMLGKEAALFVASGTMGNLTAILTHSRRGDEAIVGLDSHTFRYEAGGMASLGGVMPYPLPTDGLGRMALADIAAAVRVDDPHYPRSRLILLENSYGAKHGAPIPAGYFAAVREVADRHGLRVHLDGARYFNAVVALGISPKEIAGYVDSVSFCLSKGLCAPAGSILVGSAEFIHQARRVRKVLGGGMRQTGVLAAAGMVALTQMVDRLADDHARARQLALGLAEIPGLVLDPALVQTNMVFFELADAVALPAGEIVQRLRTLANVWVDTSGPRRFRVVTHYWIDDKAVELFLETLRTVLRNG